MMQLLSDPRKWPIGTSCGLFDSFNLQDMLACRQAGINHIEIILFGDWMKQYNVNIRSICQDIYRQIQQAGILIWSVHLPFGFKWDISNPEPNERAAAVSELEQTLIDASVLHPEKIIIHPSCEPISLDQRQSRLQASRESLLILSRKATDMRMQLAVECLPRTCLGNTADEMLALIDDNPYIGVCCDVNHMFYESPQDFIRKVGARISTIHVSDHDGIDERHWLPGRGINHWDAIICALAAAGYAGPFMYEVNAKTALRPITPQVLADNWQELLAKAVITLT
jgi:sugar phosphate isomerase/epimerase